MVGVVVVGVLLVLFVCALGSLIAVVEPSVMIGFVCGEFWLATFAC